MQTFYDKIVSPEKDSPKDWKLQLTEVDLEELGVIIESTRGWQPWGE